MRSSQRSLSRISYYSSYLLGSKALPVYILTALLSIVIAVSMIYKIYVLFAVFSTFLGFAIVLVIIASANGLIEEINTGVADLVIASGISRVEYVFSWILSTIIYPVIMISASILLPAFITDPETLLNGIRHHGGFSFPPLGLMTLTLALQLYINTFIALVFGLLSRKKSVSWLIVSLLSIIIPLVGAFISPIAAFAAGSYGYKLYMLINYMMNFIFNPYYAYMFAYTYDPENIVLPAVTIGVSSALAFLSTISFYTYAKNHMEV